MNNFPMLLTAAVLVGASCVDASTIIAGDPSPNTYDPITFAPIDGGIGFRWTVSMGENDSGSIQGHVGAWSWDEDSNPETEKGWTHTSNWVALTLLSSSQLTVRLEWQAGVPNPTAQDPGALAGVNLYPGLSIYAGWDGDGIDHHTYNNRGNVAWAEDVTYLDHVANDGTASFIERTWSLPAGNYSIALGGNSPSTDAEGRQGYLATFTTATAPEPSGALLVLVALAQSMIRRRRE